MERGLERARGAAAAADVALALALWRGAQVLLRQLVAPRAVRLAVETSSACGGGAHVLSTAKALV
jgi:hypothetical protein